MYLLAQTTINTFINVAWKGPKLITNQKQYM